METTSSTFLSYVLLCGWTMEVSFCLLGKQALLALSNTPPPGTLFRNIVSVTGSPRPEGGP